MKEMDRLVSIMETLRAPGGCPWDAAQDHESLLPALIEEAYELAEAIESADSAAMAEELGDVLLQVVFHSIIGREQGAFDLADVIDRLCQKLIYRHPHVFGETRVADAREVVRNWDQLKNGETGKKDRASIAHGIPASLPALMYAAKLQARASLTGFDWADAPEVMEKIQEEADETRAALEAGDQSGAADEIGDLIFSAVNLARKLGIDPEAAVRRANRRFAERFARIEKAAADRGISAADIPMDEKERIWQKAK
ncbi:MAG: nucleoside triphosphate pyrophosphohydrolase [Desulfosalsimonas sp.]